MIDFEERMKAGLKDNVNLDELILRVNKSPSRYQLVKFWILWRCYDIFYEFFYLSLIIPVSIFVAIKDAWLGLQEDLE